MYLCDKPWIATRDAAALLAAELLAAELVADVVIIRRGSMFHVQEG